VERAPILPDQRHAVKDYILYLTGAVYNDMLQCITQGWPMGVIIKSGKAVRATVRIARRASERRRALAVLRKSLRAKRPTGNRVGTITEDDKYDGDPA
jgi:hypothetical protein